MNPRERPSDLPVLNTRHQTKDARKGFLKSARLAGTWEVAQLTEQSHLCVRAWLCLEWLVMHCKYTVAANTGFHFQQRLATKTEERLR